MIKCLMTCEPQLLSPELQATCFNTLILKCKVKLFISLRLVYVYLINCCITDFVWICQT